MRFHRGGNDSRRLSARGGLQLPSMHSRLAVSAGRLTSASQWKYRGYEPRLAASAAMKLSTSGARSSALLAFSAPMVEVRAAPGGAEQNDPAPWVGHTAVASGRVARRCSRAL